MPPGVILAGGRGRRMGGQDKAFLPLGGRALVDHVIARIEPQVRLLAISANGDPGRFGPKRPVLADGFDDFPGPLAGILAAMDWARALGSDWVVTAATDTPFLPVTLVDRLVRAQVASAAPIILAESPAGLQPVTGLGYAGLAEGLRALAGADWSFLPHFPSCRNPYPDVDASAGHSAPTRSDYLEGYHDQRPNAGSAPGQSALLLWPLCQTPRFQSGHAR